MVIEVVWELAFKLIKREIYFFSIVLFWSYTIIWYFTFVTGTLGFCEIYIYIYTFTTLAVVSQWVIIKINKLSIYFLNVTCSVIIQLACHPHNSSNVGGEDNVWDPTKWSQFLPINLTIFYFYSTKWVYWGVSTRRYYAMNRHSLKPWPSSMVIVL